MATKWIDNWALTNWTIPTRPTLTSHILPLITEACDERVCFHAEDHFDNLGVGVTKFPRYDEKTVLLNSKNVEIRDSLYPENLAIDHEEFDEGGTASTSKILDSMTLGEMLTGPLGYASSTMLHMTAFPTIFSMDFIKQWFEVLNFPKYYFIDPSVPSPIITDMEKLDITCALRYYYNTSAHPTNPDTFTIGEMKVNGVDQYIANDLNESLPFSTPAQVRAYIKGVFDTEVVNATRWTSAIGLQNAGMRVVEAIAYEGGTQDIRFNYIYYATRYRFKINDVFRPATGQKFTPKVYLYGAFYKENNGGETFDSFNKGFTEDEIVLQEITKNGDGYFYLPADYMSVDFTGIVDLTVPTIAGNVNSYLKSCYSASLIETFSYPSGTIYILINPNADDGTGFEYYTP